MIAEDPEAAAILKKFSSKVDELKTQKVGEVVTDLCFERIPGQGGQNYAMCRRRQRMVRMLKSVAHAFREMTKLLKLRFKMVVE